MYESEVGMSGISKELTEVERAAAHARAVGTPVTVVPASAFPEVRVTPAEVKASLDTADKVLRDPEGVPVHHHPIGGERRHDAPTAATGLDPDFEWFFLGLVYANIAGIDRSLFEIYKAAGDIRLEVRTHRASDSIIDVANSSFHTNPNSGCIQGIPKEHAAPFKEYMASWRFRYSAKPGLIYGGPEKAQLWRVDWAQIYIADPLARTKVPVLVNVGLPFDLLRSRGFLIVKSPGLALNKALFAGSHIEDPEAEALLGAATKGVPSDR